MTRLRHCGFTLLELLVVVAIMAVMIAILGSTLGRVRMAARGFECKSKLKTVAFEFFQLADDFASPYRRANDGEGKGFYIDRFQEKLYGLNPDRPASSSLPKVFDPARQLLMCPAGPKRLEHREGLPCDDYPVTPVQNVSVAFNMRLRRASVVIAGRRVLREVRLNSRILRYPSMPLAFDVDGEIAYERAVMPYYSAPAAGDGGLYGSGLFWFPSYRHGMVNACFVGGHVLSSKDPEKQSDWNWRYQPEPE